MASQSLVSSGSHDPLGRVKLAHSLAEGSAKQGWSGNGAAGAGAAAALCEWLCFEWSVEESAPSSFVDGDGAGEAGAGEEEAGVGGFAVSVASAAAAAAPSNEIAATAARARSSTDAVVFRIEGENVMLLLTSERVGALEKLAEGESY